MMKDLISRHEAYKTLTAYYHHKHIIQHIQLKDALDKVPSAQPEIIRCKDCLFGYLYIDVQNGITDSWIECRNPEGLNRDVSVDGYCSASIRRRRTDE